MGLVAIGIDNGVSGSIGIINEDGAWFSAMPLTKSLDYQKTDVKYINRIDVDAFEHILKNFQSGNTRALIERPMVNPLRWNASMSAIRALEATLITLERCGIGYEYCDSKAWQKFIIPGITKPNIPKATPEKEKKKLYAEYSAKLKKAGMERAQQLYPDMTDKFLQHGDADGILIAKFCFDYYTQG